MANFDSGWQNWLHDNIQRGCTPESMHAVMVAAGLDATVATIQLNQTLRQNSLASVASPSSDLIDAPGPACESTGHCTYEYDAVPVASGHRIDLGGHTVTVAMRCEKPQVIVFNNVLTFDECDQLIERSRNKMQRSTTVNPVTGEHDVIDRRTSDGTYFDRCEDEFITRIDVRVSKLMGWPVTHGEGLQILHYNLGGEYKPHFDYFPPNEAGSTKHMSVGGQRVSTMVVYLNDVDKGGETIFPQAGLSISPQKGSAVYFRYCNAKGQIDPMTLHGGAPVLAGEKWVMTKWMRQKNYG
jgi:prolyl 4-hydroxylase